MIKAPCRRCARGRGQGHPDPDRARPARPGPSSGDPARLQQFVWNLLTNAIKFTPKGGRVQVRLERVDSHIEVMVSDTGEGIKPEFLPHLFDRFRQADTDAAARRAGARAVDREPPGRAARRHRRGREPGNRPWRDVSGVLPDADRPSAHPCWPAGPASNGNALRPPDAKADGTKWRARAGRRRRGRGPPGVAGHPRIRRGRRSTRSARGRKSWFASLLIAPMC